MEYVPGFNTLQLGEEVKRLLFRLDGTLENFTGIILYSCRCSTTFPVDQETMKKNATTRRSSNSVRILRNFNVPIATPSRKSE